MPSIPSGEIKTVIVHVRQKNGDIYVLERKIKYDPEKKYNKILSAKLLSKIPKGSEIPVPTRAKRKKSDANEADSKIVTAERTRIGMMDIIEHVGQVSGIDDAVYGSTDYGTAQKIISLARYLLASNGQTLPGIRTWQYNHPLPYEDGITEDVYHNLFKQIGMDESLQQEFFTRRCESLSENDALAYDSSTISTYSNNQSDARFGFNKAHDGLKTIKLLTLYSINSRQPVAFTKQPGNLPDVTSVVNALKQLTALGIKTREIITDNGYYSESNISEMLQAGFDFITLAKTSIKWIRPEIDKNTDALHQFSSVCPFDPSINGIVVPVKHDFVKVHKYASQKKGLKKGDTESFTKKIYIHIYFSQTRHNQANVDFNEELLELKRTLEEGIPIEELSPSAQEKATKYFKIKKWGSKLTVIPDNEAISEANKYQGYFVLISNREKNPFECLSKYRKRETIESFFRAEKQQADGSRARVWGSDTLRGRMFVQFVALCYYEYYCELIRKLKLELDKDIHEGQLSSNELAVTKRLKSWVNNTPIYLQLQWFDTVESVKISTKLRTYRRSTEVTACDSLYLKKIGVRND